MVGSGGTSRSRGGSGVGGSTNKNQAIAQEISDGHTNVMTDRVTSFQDNKDYMLISFESSNKASFYVNSNIWNKVQYANSGGVFLVGLYDEKLIETAKKLTNEIDEDSKSPELMEFVKNSIFDAVLEQKNYNVGYGQKANEAHTHLQGVLRTLTT